MTEIPSHLTGWLAAASLSPDGAVIEGAVRCPCGGERLQFHVAGTCRAVRADCPACGRQAVLFDCDLHGWDALAYPRQRAAPLPEFRPARCPQCGGSGHRGTMHLTVVPEKDARLLAGYSLGKLDEGRRIDAFTLFALDLACCACGWTLPNGALYETKGFALTHPYLPLSLELTLLFDGERFGRVAVCKRRREELILLGDFLPDPGLADLPGPLAEARHVYTVMMTTDDEAKGDAAVDRFEVLAEENARRITLAELPAAALTWFTVTDEGARLTLQTDRVGEYAARHPPRCIRELSPALLTDLPPGLHPPGDGAYFRVGCPCGERACYLLGYFWEGEGPKPDKIFVSPLALECPRCGRVSELIDTRQHGYNGEQGGDCNMTGEGPRVRFPCPGCGEAPFAAIPFFDYNGHDFDPLDPDARPQDDFGWFSLFGECGRCGKLVVVADFETA